MHFQNEIMKGINLNSLVTPHQPEPSDRKGEGLFFCSHSWYFFFPVFLPSNTFSWNAYPVHYRGCKMNQMMNSALRELKRLWSINFHYDDSEKVKWLLAEISLRKGVELGMEKSKQLLPCSRSIQNVREE